MTTQPTPNYVATFNKITEHAKGLATVRAALGDCVSPDTFTKVTAMFTNVVFATVKPVYNLITAGTLENRKFAYWALRHAQSQSQAQSGVVYNTIKSCNTMDPLVIGFAFRTEDINLTTEQMAFVTAQALALERGTYKPIAFTEWKAAPDPRTEIGALKRKNSELANELDAMRAAEAKRIATSEKRKAAAMARSSAAVVPFAQHGDAPVYAPGSIPLITETQPLSKGPVL